VVVSGEECTVGGYVEVEMPRGPYDDLPDDVEPDGTVCADCSCPVGPVLEETPAGYERCVWRYLWRAPDGRLLCEDCTIEAEGRDAEGRDDIDRPVTS
jgi:hypothetical protein